jgi:hypothetical protein
MSSPHSKPPQEFVADSQGGFEFIPSKGRIAYNE